MRPWDLQVVGLRLFVVIGLASSLSLVRANHAFAQATLPTMVVNAEATFMRAQPDIKGLVVLRLERGDVVEVLDSSGTWFRVRGGDPPREGFVHRLVLAPARATTPASPAEPRPRSDPAPPAPGRPIYDSDEASSSTGRTGQPVSPTPRPTKPAIGLRALAEMGWMTPRAKESFESVGISGQQRVFGAGAEVTNVFHGIFVRGSFERWSATGERVFISADGRRFGLGIPLKVRLTPIDATVGWRLPRVGRGSGSVVPYVGGGAGVLRYEESDPFTDSSEEVDEQFASYHGLAGAEIALISWLGVKAEYRYRFAPDSLGTGGVSAQHGDNSVGGSTFGLTLVVGQ